MRRGRNRVHSCPEVSVHRSLALLLFTGALLPGPAVASQDPRAGLHESLGSCDRQVLRVQYGDREVLQWIASRTEPWEVDHERALAVLEADASFAGELRDRGLVFTVDASLSAEACAIHVPLKGQSGGIPGFPCYRRIEETFETARRLADLHPELVELVDIGDTWEKSAGLGGHDLVVLRLTNRSLPGTGTPAAPEHKPVLFVMASVHAREYTPAETLTRFAEMVLEGYGADPDLTWILDEHELHLLLLANPDGRSRAEQGTSWRKNADNDFCSDTTSRGIDLNRNFEHLWGCCGGSSASSCSDVFRGPSPASEPETRAIQDYVRSILPAQWSPEPPADTTGVFLDLHSYGQLVLWPWGAVSDVAPNGPALEAMGRRMAFLNRATPKQAIEFYPTDGTTDDFAYGVLGVAAFTVETGYRFFEPCSVYESRLVNDMLDLLRWSAKVARAPYLLPAGPEVLELALSPRAIGAGGTVALSAVADDARLVVTGGGVFEGILRGEAYVGRPPWVDGAVPVPLTVQADPESSYRAVLSGVVDTSSLAGGRHLVFVRAQDAAGSWGPVTAAFLDVECYDVPPRRGGTRVGG